MEGATSINTTLLVDINVESFPPYIYIYSNPLSKAYQSLMRLNFSTFHWIAHHQPLIDTGRASVHRPRISSFWSRLSIFKSSAWWFTVEDDNLPLLFQTVLSSCWIRCHIGVRVFLPTCPRQSQVCTESEGMLELELITVAHSICYSVVSWCCLEFQYDTPKAESLWCCLFSVICCVLFDLPAITRLRCICWIAIHQVSGCYRLFYVNLNCHRSLLSLIFLLCSAPTM